MTYSTNILDQFFLELWIEINERSALRAKVDAHPSLPTTAHAKDSDQVEGTLFDELIGQYTAVANRAEDMIIRHISSEVEVELKGYFAKYAPIYISESS